MQDRGRIASSPSLPRLSSRTSLCPAPRRRARAPSRRRARCAARDSCSTCSSCGSLRGKGRGDRRASCRAIARDGGRLRQDPASHRTGLARCSPRRLWHERRGSSARRVPSPSAREHSPSRTSGRRAAPAPGQRACRWRGSPGQSGRRACCPATCEAAGSTRRGAPDPGRARRSPGLRSSAKATSIPWRCRDR